MSFVFSYEIFKALLCWWTQSVKDRHTLFEKLNWEKKLVKFEEGHVRTFNYCKTSCLHRCAFMLIRIHLHHINVDILTSLIYQLLNFSKKTLEKIFCSQDIYSPVLWKILRFSQFTWDGKILCYLKVMPECSHSDNFRTNDCWQMTKSN